MFDSYKPGSKVGIKIFQRWKNKNFAVHWKLECDQKLWIERKIIIQDGTDTLSAFFGANPGDEKFWSLLIMTKPNQWNYYIKSSENQNSTKKAPSNPSKTQWPRPPTQTITKVDFQKRIKSYRSEKLDLRRIKLKPKLWC